MIKKVVLKGPVLTNSGYGVHCRQVFKALIARENIDLYVIPTEWGNSSWILDSKFNNGIIENILKHAKKPQQNVLFDESFQVLLPDEWTNIAIKNIGITAGFEADIVKSSWIDCVNEMDYVIVPSEFTRNAFVKTSKENNINILKEIKVINEWYYDEFDKLEENILENEDFDRKILQNLEYDKNILIMAQITSNSAISDRKNIIKTIEDAVTFVNDKDIGVVLKINAGKYANSEKAKIEFLLKEEIGKEKLKKVSLIFGSLSIKELYMLYKSEKISCMLTGTRAEGWGLPLVESAACGLPIIATNYSSYKEFLEDDFLGIDYDLINFCHDKRFVDVNTMPKWAEYDSGDMQNKLEYFFKNKQKHDEIAECRQKIIKQKYNSTAIINNYIDFFKNIS